MHRRHFVLASLASLSALSTLTACGTTPTLNNTAFPHRLKQDALKAPVRKVLIPAVHLHGPTGHYLSEGDALVARQLREYLARQGLTVVDNRHFMTAWANAVRFYGQPHDPTTDRVNKAILEKVLVSALNAAQENEPFDLVLFTDFVPRKVSFSPSGQHRARWDGVSRRPILTGPDNYVPGDYDWAKPADAVSLSVMAYNQDYRLVFHNVVGIDLIDTINTRYGNPRFKRRENPFQYTSHMEEAVILAMDPLLKAIASTASR